MRKINNNNLDILIFIKSFINENGFSPSYRDILKGTNYKSTQSVWQAIIKLEELGFIKTKKDYRGNIISRSIQLIENEDTKKLIDELRKGE